jgi:DNA topoisomerase VI subunit A
MARKINKPVAGKTDTGGKAVTRGKETAKKIESLSQDVIKSVSAHRDPGLDIPTRNLSNVSYNTRRKMIQMGGNKQTRNFFNLGQAKKFMQTVLVAQGAHDLIEEGKTTSLRGMFYKSLHTIAGTSEKTFSGQEESDTIIEDLEVSLGSLREELHLFAKKRGTIVGNITIEDNGDTIDCRRMGTGGYAIPSIVEPDIIKFKKCEAKFILHVEKDTVWNRFNEDRFWEKHNCILTEGSGQPPRGVRRLLQRLHNELKLPVYCLLDNDPWGYYIYSVIKTGSINLAYESQRMAIPDAKYLGLRSIDYERCSLTDDVKIELDDGDRRRSQQIANYEWFKDKKEWQKEIEKLMKNGFKMEVESLISKSISYVTEEYVPERLKKKDWLD